MLDIHLEMLQCMWKVKIEITFEEYLYRKALVCGKRS